MSKRHTISLTPEAAEFHRSNFAEFCRLELLAHGPDPHIAMVAAAADGHGLWRAGCYINAYTFGGGAAVWTAWSTPASVLDDQEAFRQWVAANWAGIPMRRERRAVKSKPKFAECMLSYAGWMTSHFAFGMDYEQCWASVRGNVKYFGRYATIKLLETLHRMGAIPVAMQDIMPRGAWSPRLTLSYMWPEYDLELNSSSDAPAVLQLANTLALQARDLVQEHCGVLPTWFQVEVLLCNYRQAIERKYPGRAHDSEMGYYRKAEAYWGKDRLAGDFWGVREALFPRTLLGEFGGWEGERKECCDTYLDRGYFWSDVLYDYEATVDRGDWAHPVERAR